MEPKIRGGRICEAIPNEHLAILLLASGNQKNKTKNLERKKNPIPSVLSKGAPKLFAEMGKGKFKTKIKNC